MPCFHKKSIQDALDLPKFLQMKYISKIISDHLHMHAIIPLKVERMLYCHPQLIE